MSASTVVYPNEILVVQNNVESGMIARPWPVLMTFLRLILFAFFQALLALAFLFSGAVQPWNLSIPWWPLSAIFTNLVCLYLLSRLFKGENLRYRDLLAVDRKSIGKDMLILLGAFIIIGPIAFLPNILLGNFLFGDSQIAANLMFRPLPMWAAITAFIFFPITQGLTELPTYFGYSEPRLSVLWKSKWAAILFTGFFLALQHMVLPLIFDWRFIMWRAGMYLFFALSMALLLSFRPRLMPYCMLIHWLMDISAAWFLISASLT